MMTDSSHTIQLESTTSSTIRNVTLYPSRAEITRVFKFGVNVGQNGVHINGLPNAIDRQSLRVDGVGEITIRDVIISNIPTASNTFDNSTPQTLLLEKERTQKALERCKQSQSSLENLFGTMNIQHVDVGNLSNIVRSYDATAEELDEKMIELDGKMKEIEKKIREENQKAGMTAQRQLGMRVSVVVFADTGDDIELVLTYACAGYQQTWKAGYDIRVDMAASEKQVFLVYKAIVKQDTGESWDNVPLTLDTATPTYGASLPSLGTWSIAERARQQTEGTSSDTKLPPSIIIDPRAHDDSRLAKPVGESWQTIAAVKRSKVSSTTVTSKGNVNATFRVPGVVNIPSKDNDERTFTIVEVKLDAAIIWTTVPKKEPRVMFKARITNTSEYTLLNGQGSVYVDGSFISRIDVPLVSPMESFDCPLGYDPTVRVTYHEIRKKESTSGFYSKTKEHLFTQSMTIHNTKNVPIPVLKVVDQIPVSEVSGIEVRLINPPLKLSDPTNASKSLGTADSSSGTVGGGAGSTEPSQRDDETNKSLTKSLNRFSVGNTANLSRSYTTSTRPSAPKIKVSEDIFAQWDGADEPEGVNSETTARTLGSDGKLNWVCRVPAQTKMDLVLQYEIRVPAKMDVSFEGVKNERP
ncbi:hypothetical protein K435DRAFT_759668 [Dendrothele bispora CBS 962.96]|uniref:Mucoidy inhibitor A n=1 Tax=Dendrothele bispora (strain CBS 962.96) TaxID=1314807 RepID=A0A4S8LNX7_DENBC|nr:hypothetical protein K435DRAFT_759668 [Dendrothele bispora CBS 962.96]